MKTIFPPVFINVKYHQFLHLKRKLSLFFRTWKIRNYFLPNVNRQMKFGKICQEFFFNSREFKVCITQVFLLIFWAFWHAMLIKDIQFFKYVIPRHYTIFLPDIWEGTSNRISYTIFFDFKMKKIEVLLT